MRPDVAAAFDRIAAAAREEAGLCLSINSAFRSDAEQARLFAANPNSYLFPLGRAALVAFAAGRRLPRVSRPGGHRARATCPGE